MFDTINQKHPWFIGGLAFQCQGCGRCCAGPEEGYVWATPRELLDIAKYLKIRERDFYAKFVRKVQKRFSLLEKKGSNDCVFLENGKCRIYPVRPTQCRTWPFWHSNIASPNDWSETALRCRGINRGPLHPVDEIQAKANDTTE